MALEESGYKGDWIPIFIDIALKNITPPYVTISDVLKLFAPASDGIEHIRTALNLSQSSEEAEIKTTYIGAPNYRISVKAPNYKVAEDAMAASAKKAIDYIEKNGGHGKFER
jgi:translation initiation factor 2 subunit 1